MKRKKRGTKVRRKEIIDTARDFFFKKGYDETTVEDIIEELGIAKGTFYYYYESKMDLLNELIDKITTEMSVSLKPVVDSNIDAIEKFNTIFRKGSAFKVDNIDLFVIMLKVLFKDENTVLRDKMYRQMVKKNTKLLIPVIKQGIKEGMFNTPHPDEAAEMILQMGKSLNETICRILMQKDKQVEFIIDTIKRKVEFYQFSIERILGARRGSLDILGPDFEGLVKIFFEKIKYER
jgi:AcrR family transcriptional regulator